MQSLAVGFLVVCLGPGARANVGDEKPITVPFDTLKTQHIVVMVKLNGKGPYRLIFDTGAPVTLINNKIARDSGVVPKDSKPMLPLFGSPQQHKIKVFELGGVRAENASAIIMDHPLLTAMDKVIGPVEGIVGLSFFGKYRVTIDYQAKEMTFVPVKFTPPDVLSAIEALQKGGGPKTKVVAPAGQWGFSVSKDPKDEQPGVTVEHVVAGSPAAAAGLRVGDRLLTLEGRWTDSVADCFVAAANVQPGQAARLVVLRDGKEVELRVRVQAGL